MAKWRPENWEKNHPYHYCFDDDDEMKRLAFERGADAMLEALRQKGDTWPCIPGDQWYLFTKQVHPDSAMFDSQEVKINPYPQRKGFLVFIPDEDKPDG
jgi:hypothetical protein